MLIPRKKRLKFRVKQSSTRGILNFRDKGIKSDGQEKSTKILISLQDLKNQFLSFFVHR